MLRKWAGLAALSLIATIAGAQPQTYSQRGTQIRAGIVIIDSSQIAGVPANPTPFVWYNLDSNLAVKPAGWNIYNPNAPAQASQQIVNRWTLINGAIGGGAPNLFDRITKRMAAYWEVQLSALTDAQLSQYDVLLLNASGNVSLNTLEREKLRQFVDRGGVLWVEVASLNQGLFADNTVNNFPLPFNVTTGGGLGNFDQFHPILNYPNQFNVSDLGYLNGNNNAVLNQVALGGSVASLASPVVADWFRLKPVVLSGANATMMVGRIGDGFMVVTSRNAAGYLNQINTGGAYAANQGYYSMDPRGGLDRGADVLGRLAINVISLGSGSEQIAGGSRKMGSSPVDISAPLLKRYESQVAALDPGMRNNFPAAAYKGIVVLSANNRIYVFDANPKQDLDGDNNPDDGLQDYSQGNNMDLLWASQPLTAPISAPTCIEVAQPAAGVPSDQILVTDGQGRVQAFNAFPTNPANQIIGSMTAAPVYTVDPPTAPGAVDTSQVSHGPYAPTYQEGLVYVATNPSSGLSLTGQVWVMDPAQGTGLSTGAQRWLVGDPTSPAINEISASPTVGYIPIADNSGGLDRVVYVPTRPGNSINAGIYSLWAGVRGESPTSFTVGGGLLTVRTRAFQRGLYLVTNPGSLGIKLTILDSNGNPLPNSTMNGLFNGSINQGVPGEIEFGMTGAWDPNYKIRIDYTIDWGRGPGSSLAIVRGNIFLPDDPNNRRTILGNIAMSPRGTIYVVQSSGADSAGTAQGGAFWAFREQGQGAFNCVTRYDVYGPHTVNLNQAAPVQIPATVSDTDGVIGFAPILGGTPSRLTYMGGPVVRGDLVYVPAIMHKVSGAIPFAPFIPYTVLFAFKAEPEAPEIYVGDLSDGFSLVQPDLVRSGNKTLPTVLNVASRGQFQYLRESGKIRFDSLMSPNRGQINSAFSLSQPVVVRSGGRPDTLVQPDASGGSRWSPLAWYTVLHGTSDPTTPVATGGTLFVGGSSALPYFLNLVGAPVLPPPTTGVLFGINADISERDPFTISDTSRPWLRQVYFVKSNGIGGLDGNPNIRWPQNVGVKTFADWRLRVLQASMPGTGRTISLAAGEGGLFATGGAANGSFGGDGYIYGFSRADFVVCDEGRLGRFDPAGNPIFATDVSANSGTETNVGAATSVKTLQRPSRAYPVGANDLIVVDPGTNRVVRLDGQGKELRSIDGFKIDANSGITLESNEPLKLNNPRDVAYFSEYVNNPTNVDSPQTREFWMHYVIADAGNRRIVDVIDRHYVGPNGQIGDAIQLSTGQRAYAMLRWHSPAEYSGKRFEYNSITRAADPLTNQYYYIAGIGSANPARVDVGLDSPAPSLPRETPDGNGGIVVFNPNNPAVNEVINEVAVPAIGANVYIDPQTFAYDPAARAARQKKLSNLSSVTVRKVPFGATSLFAIMFTDATGVYEIVNPSGTPNGWTVRWMIPNEAYRFLRNSPSLTWPGGNASVFLTNPLQLRATYARRLDSGEVLIVNGFVGKYRDSSSFTGEVVQIDGDINSGAGTTGFDWNKPNFGFYFGSVRFELPPITGTRGLYQPIFADRR